MPLLRRRKVTDSSKSTNSESTIDKQDDKKNQSKRFRRESYSSEKWSCWDSCCWFIGFICSMWWFLLFLYNTMPASIPQYVTEAITGHLPDPPGVKLRKEGLTVNHPVVFVPGIVTGGLELWEGHQCADGLFRKRLWGGSFGELYKRPLCWAEHMSLDNETGLDPPGIRVRPVSGLVAADYFAAGYFVWAVLIANLAQIGYEEKTMYMAAYDWRLSFQNTEVRDQTLSRIKSNIELMVATNGGKKVVVIPHSMGVLYFLHFMKWVEAPAPMGGGGGSDWCAKHIKAVMNIGAPFLGVPKSVSGLFSIEARDIAIARAFAPGFLDKDVFGLQTFQHLMRMTRTWDSTMSMIPKGGDTIWGGLDWSPEGGSFKCSAKKLKKNSTHNTGQNANSNLDDMKSVNYGRIISFGKDVAEAHSSKIERVDFRQDTVKGDKLANSSNCDIWIEYHEMDNDSIKAVADYKVYTAGSILDLLHFVAPKLMARGGAHFSYGIADNLDDPKYEHFKYWSNPLETKLPNAPDMEIYSMYGVGIPTERAYVYKLITAVDCYIPFQIDTSSEGGSEDSCLKGGVFSADGDETVPVLSAGFMCAKGWRGKTRFNPSGIRTYIREYNHAPPANLLEGRGTQSGAHVDIMGNFALIEDIIRVAAGATSEDLGGDRVYSDIFKWSDRINLQL
ncbi:phospholipid:diacylglycerol acyltransferase 1-like isoform X1 [Durio zibethinus]|uniref:phospholipid:diacylglycerol acyltransferase n=1 Tax=Durio zibethinus TaxID=66656 RepID=A0A6P5ZQH2_DURZI|nr:phospholipid:diacylglycerol acyltransferase 1-like isoform X1 [Durio zibethinus]XP_022754813.1 phospholipid:diacylglycerol acyltransferase 1-like isoform X1 [Durio zibethinus]XP_022754814.1 phospholipid:diacylglycerol acyltransferase 1-like isoform X1 [Durio zibethinus]XP_022754815.1 phospholipid:diacylglycerol acyltransferase 1-like isoform X1 [Durio zibethinus]